MGWLKGHRPLYIDAAPEGDLSVDKQGETKFCGHLMAQSVLAKMPLATTRGLD